MSAAAIILAGGLGTRMRPLTDDCPKPLLWVGDGVLIGRLLQQLASAGISEVVLALSHMQEQFSVLRDGSPWGVRLHFAYSPELLGTGGAIAHAWDFFRRSVPAQVVDEIKQVVVMNGDLLTSHSISQQMQAAAGLPAVLHVQHKDDVRAYGLVGLDPAAVGKGKLPAVHTFREKPSKRIGGLVNAGTYVFATNVLDDLTVQKCSLERDVFPGWAQKGWLFAWRDDTPILDVGNPAALLQAALISFPEGVCADSAEIGPQARLERSLVWPWARVGADSHVVECLVLEGAIVPAGSNYRRKILRPGHPPISLDGPLAGPDPI